MKDLKVNDGKDICEKEINFDDLEFYSENEPEDFDEFSIYQLESYEIL
jgi:hypothetical protein